MQKEQITDKEGICILTLFIMGTTLILGTGGEAKNDAWISGIIGILMAIPIILVYSRILYLFQGRDLYEILYVIFGNSIGKVISIMYIWYAFHLGALVHRNFGSFIVTVTMTETPIMFPMLCLVLVCIIAVRSGVEVIGRISALSLPVLMGIIVMVGLLVVPKLNLHYIKPILSKGLGTVIKAGFNAFSFPYAETIMLTTVFFSLKTKKSIYKVYFSGLFLAASIIVYITLRNILVLGEIGGKFYFPSYMAVSRIQVGDFLERIEVTVAIVFLFGAFIKGTICLFAVCKGISKVLQLKDYRSIVIQVGLLMVFFGYIVYDNIMQMEKWAFKIYPYYAFPFQVILPIFIWIIAEIKTKKAAK